MGGWAPLSNSTIIVAAEVHLCVFSPHYHLRLTFIPFSHPSNYVSAVAGNTQHNKLNLDH